MNCLSNARTAQPSAAGTSSPRALAFATAHPFRAALLGLLAVVGSAGAAQAQQAQPVSSVSPVKAIQPDAQSLSFTVENPAQKRLQLQVLCLDNNKYLVNEGNRLPSYGCQLHFRSLPAGRYAVLLRVGSERYRYTVQVQAKTQTTIVVPGLAPSTADEVVASVAR